MKLYLHPENLFHKFLGVLTYLINSSLRMSLMQPTDKLYILKLAIFHFNKLCSVFSLLHLYHQPVFYISVSGKPHTVYWL